MKIKLFLIAFLFSSLIFGQKFEVDVMLMKAASDFSKYEPGIGIFIIAGKEFDSISDSELNLKFEDIFRRKELDIKVKLFIQRIDIRNGSSYDMFSLGVGVYETVTFKNLKPALRAAVDHYNSFNGKVYIAEKDKDEFKRKKEEYEKNKS